MRINADPSAVSVARTFGRSQWPAQASLAPCFLGIVFHSKAANDYQRNQISLWSATKRTRLFCCPYWIRKTFLCSTSPKPFYTHQ